MRAQRQSQAKGKGQKPIPISGTSCCNLGFVLSLENRGPAVLQTNFAPVVRMKTTTACDFNRSNKSWPIAGLLFAVAVLVAVPISVRLTRTGELGTGWVQAFADGPDPEDRVRVYRRSHRYARRVYRRAYRVRPFYYSCVGYFGPGCCGAPEPCRRGWIR